MSKPGDNKDIDSRYFLFKMIPAQTYCASCIFILSYEKFKLRSRARESSGQCTLLLL